VSQQQSGDKVDRAWRTARVVVASALLIGTALLILLSYIRPDFRVCRAMLAQTGATQQVCGPIGTDDIVPLVLVAAVVFLLLPDLAEVTMGSFGLRKKVKELESEVARLSVSQNVNSLNASTQSVIVNLEQSIETTTAKASRLANPADDEQDALPFAKRHVSDERAQAETRIIRLWNDVNGVLQNLDAPPESAATAGYSRFLSAARDWRVVFKDEIADLRAVRNTVVHRPENLTDEQVREGIELATRLISALTEMAEPPARG
jgi:hypothetical protein